jgi:hypothetical protein
MDVFDQTGLAGRNRLIGRFRPKYVQSGRIRPIYIRTVPFAAAKTAKKRLSGIWHTVCVLFQMLCGRW